MVDVSHIFSYENKINNQKRLPAKFNFNLGKMTCIRLPKSLTFSLFFSSPLSLSLSPFFYANPNLTSHYFTLFLLSFSFFRSFFFGVAAFFSHCLVSDSCIALCFSLTIFKKILIMI